ncbi:MAG: alpha/beta hydrolase [Firmicutes bacterium]|nr:alpha/beta hydrolase [Bacillota bacterium]
MPADQFPVIFIFVFILGLLTYIHGIGGFAEAGGTDLNRQIRGGEEITLKTPTGNIHGTLQVPETARKYPVVLIIAGSGPTDRDGNSPLLLGRNDSLKMIALGLQENGIASVRYDKRGIAGSSDAMAGKTEADLRFDDYVDDAVAWVEDLQKDSRFSHVIILGHSEGALIGTAAANKTPGLSGIISISGAGRPAYDLITEQLSNEEKEIRDEACKILNELREGRLIGEIRPELMPLFRPSVQPYLISWFKYNPVDEIRNLDIPLLILHGTTDIQVNVEDAKLLKDANQDARLKIIDGMNHVLKSVSLDPQENLAAYSDPSLPLAPGFLKEIVSFIRSCTTKRL